MQFIDTHIHLQDYKSSNATDIISQAQAKGCVRLICVSAVEADWAIVIELAEKFPDMVVPALGIHPWYVSTVQEGWKNRLEGYLCRYPQALIGECGLDRLKLPDPELQKNVFLTQIDLAKRFNRPLIIHAVKATEWLNDFWEILPKRFVFHSFNGKPELIKQIIKYGGYIGVGASVLRNPKIKEIIKLIPADRLLLETDGPYQSLYIGQEGMPWFITEQINKLAALTGQNEAELATQIYHNSLEFIK